MQSVFTGELFPFSYLIELQCSQLFPRLEKVFENRLNRPLFAKKTDQKQTTFSKYFQKNRPTK